jgi:hypothetical protein
VYNPHAAIDLTQAEEGPGPVRCEPSFEVVLSNGHFTNSIGFSADCSTRSFIIATGTNRFSIAVFTSYNGCSKEGSGTVSQPRCPSSGGLPPLPLGRYKTVIEWSGPVPLPKPAPVSVELT